MDLKEQEACLDENEANQKKKKEGFFKSTYAKITLEPMWFGVVCSFMISIIAFKNLYLQRACLVDLGYSEEVCFRSVGPEKTRVELESQRIVSSTMVGSSLIGGFITVLIVLFLGPWSDASGRRKPLIVMPIIGMCLGSVMLFITLFFPNLPTIWVIYAHAMPIAIGGHFSVLGIAAFSYLGDICYKTGRCVTIVMGTNSGCFSLFMVIGTILGPLVYRYLGFKGLFVVCFILELQSLLYVIFRVKDINVSEKKHNILDLTYPLQALKCVFKKRESTRRRNILLMVMVPCCNTLIYVAELGVTYMYLRNKFDWTEVEYSAFLTYKSILHVIGTFLIVSVIKKKFKVRDKYIGIAGGISQLLSSLAFMMSYNAVLLFTTTTVGILARGAMIAERPVLNKQIKADEQGKISCITSLFEKCSSFIIVPLVNLIYAATLETFPACFQVLCVTAALIQIICYLFVKMDREAEEAEKNEAS